MKTVTAIIALISAALLLIKYISKRSGQESLDRFLMKNHKLFSLVFLVSGLVHLLMMAGNLSTDTAALAISGFTAYIVSVLLIALCHMQKDELKKMRWHRIMSLIMLIAIVIHFVL